MDKSIKLRKFYSVATHEDIPHQQSLVNFSTSKTKSHFHNLSPSLKSMKKKSALRSIQDDECRHEDRKNGSVASAGNNQGEEIEKYDRYQQIGCIRRP